jgi:hypothetical protein
MPNPASLRTCLVTREKHHPSALLRFTKEGATIAPNLFNKQTGRGVYVKCAKSILAKAIKQGNFAKGFRTQMKVSEGLISEIDTKFRIEITRLAKIEEKMQQPLLFFTEKSIDAFFENEKISDKLLSEKLKNTIQKYQQFISN